MFFSLIFINHQTHSTSSLHGPQYESNSVQNQSLVYQDFLALSYKSSLATFLDDLDARLSSLSAVGLIVGTPEKADIKESLLAEHILSKLPPEFGAAKEILYQKRPLTVAIIQEFLDTKRRDASVTSSNIMVKQESALKAKSSSTKPSGKKNYPQCTPGGGFVSAGLRLRYFVNLYRS
ncbi:uncharacterized protein VP01_7311g1 [Puccinia sorghi]|uniref:Uncharacterized protein n=1 Tax=Puccinia sorghi TaxID=27349 RepID=A0A0L6UCX4_9BASI|nr:uncharacterized protein VP01_7311g1 [Puccinia sorghi]